jgi:Flp pilus assembly CpaE family ATPase
MVRVVLALEASDVAEEVMQFLDRTGWARVVAVASDDRELEAAAHQGDADVVIAQPSLVGAAENRLGRWLALETRESVASLRSAVRGGATGYFLWPAERDALADAAAAITVRSVADRPRARVVAVHASRGGAGTTFVATHLAAAFAHAGTACALVDLDPLHGDVAAALGIPEEGIHTMSDLLPLGDELDEGHLRAALWQHPTGFTTLPPPPPQEAASVPARVLASVVEAAAAGTEVVVLHLPRTLMDLGAVVEGADRIVEVMTLDVLAFRSASRALEAVDVLGARDRIGYVVNRAQRGEITPGDVERVFGAPPVVVLPHDRGVPRAQDHGRLLPPRGRLGRGFARLAAASMTSPEPEVVSLTGEPH